MAQVPGRSGVARNAVVIVHQHVHLLRSRLLLCTTRTLPWLKALPMKANLSFSGYKGEPWSREVVLVVTSITSWLQGFLYTTRTPSWLQAYTQHGPLLGSRLHLPPHSLAPGSSLYTTLHLLGLKLKLLYKTYSTSSSPWLHLVHLHASRSNTPHILGFSPLCSFLLY